MENKQNKNINLYYDKGYITQFEMCSMLIFKILYNNCNLEGGSFDYSRLNVQTSGKNGGTTEFIVTNTRKINKIINKVTKMFAINNFSISNLYLFLDFILLDFTIRDLKNKYKISYKNIKEIVLFLVSTVSEIMKEEKLLNEKLLK